MKTRRVSGHGGYAGAGAVMVVMSLLAACSDPSSPPEPPPAPTDVTASASSATVVQLTWTMPAAANPDQFVIQRSTLGQTFASLDTVPGSQMSYTDTTASEATTYRYRVAACNGTLCSSFTATASSVTTFGRLTIETDSLSFGVVGQPYSAAIHAAGGGGDYTWQVTTGSLPAGLALTAAASPTTGESDALISGTPETAQTASFSVRVQSGDGEVVEAPFSITIYATAAPVSVTTNVVPPVVVNGTYDIHLEAAGGTGSGTFQWSLVNSTPPPGLTFESTGRIHGTPTTVGSYTFTVQAESGGETGQATFTTVVVPNRTDRFDITAYPVTPIPVEIRSAVDAAIAKWESVLTGDIPVSVIGPDFFDPSYCLGFGDAANGTTVEDIMILINIGPIDGVGNIIGQAGPCALRNNGYLPSVGTLTLDSDDLDQYVGTPTLTALILHEMGHILGYGTLWDRFNLLQGAGTSNPTYTGTQAVAEYHALGGTGDIPVENKGGPGTADSHWRETTFDTEVMTGYIEAIGVPEPLSRMSVASFADLGYTVDLSKADPYSLPSAGLRAGEPQDSGLEINDAVYHGPVLIIGEHGVVRTINLR